MCGPDVCALLAPNHLAPSQAALLLFCTVPFNQRASASLLTLFFVAFRSRAFCPLAAASSWNPCHTCPCCTRWYCMWCRKLISCGQQLGTARSALLMYPHLPSQPASMFLAHLAIHPPNHPPANQPASQHAPGHPLAPWQRGVGCHICVRMTAESSSLGVWCAARGCLSAS